MSSLDLYYLTQLETKVSLKPDQIDGNLDDHLLNNLRAKIEGKAIDSGIVIRIYKLIDYQYGTIDKTNFMGTTVFPVNYECFICSPIKNLEIVCVLENIVKGFLIGRNGPIMVVIQFNNIDTQRFEVNDNGITIKKTKNLLKKGNHLKVQIISINNNLGEKTIVTMCKLLNLANDNEIKMFNQDQDLVVGNDNDAQEFI